MGEELFPDALQILDFYHLAENIYSFGKYLFPEEAKQYMVTLKAKEESGRWGASVRDFIMAA
jgi:hypothetical protein